MDKRVPNSNNNTLLLSHYGQQSSLFRSKCPKKIPYLSGTKIWGWFTLTSLAQTNILPCSKALSSWPRCDAVRHRFVFHIGYYYFRWKNPLLPTPTFTALVSAHSRMDGEDKFRFKVIIFFRCLFRPEEELAKLLKVHRDSQILFISHTAISSV